MEAVGHSCGYEIRNNCDNKYTIPELIQYDLKTWDHRRRYGALQDIFSARAYGGLPMLIKLGGRYSILALSLNPSNLNHPSGKHGIQDPRKGVPNVPQIKKGKLAEKANLP